MKASLLTTSVTDDKNTVFCIYLDEYLCQFVVEWNRCEDDEFDLSPYVMSSDDGLTSRISDAIRKGETDENTDLELYLVIRDTFGNLDCKSLADDE